MSIPLPDQKQYQESNLNVTGLDLDLLDNNSSSLFQMVICPVCLDICRNPVEAFVNGRNSKAGCHHIGCKDCIHASIKIKSECPSCHQYLDLNGVRESIFAKRMIYNIRLKCPHFAQGCLWTCGIGDYTKKLEHHKNVDCQCFTIPCPFDTSHPPLCRQLMITHEKECPSRFKICPCCEGSFHYNEFQNHLDNCPQNFVQCPKHCFSHYASLQNLPCDVNGVKHIIWKKRASEDPSNQAPCILSLTPNQCRDEFRSIPEIVVHEEKLPKESVNLCSLSLHKSTLIFSHVEFKEHLDSVSNDPLSASSTDDLLIPRDWEHWTYNHKQNTINIRPQYLFRDLEQHLRECPLRLVLCPFKKLGCEASDLKANQLTEHIQSATKHHDSLTITPRSQCFKIKDKFYNLQNPSYFVGPTYPHLTINDLLDYKDVRGKWYLAFIRCASEGGYTVGFFDHLMTKDEKFSRHQVCGVVAYPWSMSEGATSYFGNTATHVIKNPMTKILHNVQV